MRSVFVPLVILALAGCSDPKAASEKNFKTAVQNYLDALYPRCYVVSSFPAFKSDWDINHSNEKLAALAKAGLLTEKEVEVEEKDFMGRLKTVKKLSYNLNDEGKKYYKAAVAKNMRGDSLGGLCAGKATVKSIVQYSEPADMMGLKVSQVNYEYTVAGLPKWASSPELQKYVEGLKPDVDSQDTPVKKAEAVILTNNGWVHEKLFSR